MDILPTVDFYQKFNSKFEVEEPLIGDSGRYYPWKIISFSKRPNLPCLVLYCWLICTRDFFLFIMIKFWKCFKW